MKLIAICLLTLTAVCTQGSAAVITCQSTLVSLTPGGASPTFSCDGLTFSNFVLTNLSGTTGGHLDINSVTFDTTTNEVFLAENPNLGSGGHENLLFTVTGGLSNIDLSVGGTLSTVTERACNNPIPLSGGLANLCTNAAGTISATPLGEITVHSGDPNQPVVASFSSTTPVFIFKDIASATGGGLSTLNESFRASGLPAVPEPGSMLLMGSALLGIGIWRRRSA